MKVPLLNQNYACLVILRAVQVLLGYVQVISTVSFRYLMRLILSVLWCSASGLDNLMTVEEKEKFYTAIGYSGSSHNLALPKQVSTLAAGVTRRNVTV